MSPPFPPIKAGSSQFKNWLNYEDAKIFIFWDGILIMWSRLLLRGKANDQSVPFENSLHNSLFLNFGDLALTINFKKRF